MPIEAAGRINDPTNITGIGPMLHGDDVGSDVDWNSLEKTIIGNIGINFNAEKEQQNLDQDYAKELMRLSNQYNATGKPPTTESSSRTTDPYGFDSKSMAGDFNLSPPTPQKSFSSSFNSTSPPSSMGNRTNNQNGGFFGSTQNTSSSSSNTQFNDPQMKNMTHEQHNKHVINSVLGSLGGDNSSNNNAGITEGLAREREADSKIRQLDQIHSLRTSLQEDNVDIERIPVVSLDNSMNEINEVLRYLLVISDNRRCSSLAEEFILMGAQGAGFVCDGKRRILGRRPDLTDWHKTVAVKLRHLRHDTSMLVSGVMKKYNIGPGWRIAMELLPSMFYHSAIRSKRTESDYISDNEFNDALGKIRDIDESNHTD
jgi:hypothetical protein